MYVLQNGSDWSPRFAVYGDLGYVNGISIPLLAKETSSRNWDVVLHLGENVYPSVLVPSLSSVTLYCRHKVFSPLILQVTLPMICRM